MTSYLKQSLPDDFAVVLSGPQPPDDRGFTSDRIQILWTSSDQSWVDPGQHLHTDSDEVYIVLKGTMVLEVEEDRVTISAGEICFVPAGVFHAVVAVETPIQSFCIRSPVVPDKVYRDT